MRTALTFLACSCVAVSASAQTGWSRHFVGPRAQVELRRAEHDVGARVAAAERLSRYGEPHHAVAALVEALEVESEPRVLAAIIDGLARRGDEVAVRPLAARLAQRGSRPRSTRAAWADGDREAAIRAIGAIGGEEAIRMLVDWLGVPDLGDHAAAALADMGASAVPHLVRALNVPTTSARAARALGQIGDTRATISLVGLLLGGATPEVRVEVLAALGAIGDERAASAVARLLSDADPAIVTAALESLPRLAGPEHAGPVASLADRGTVEQRAAALRALIQMDPVAAHPRVEAVISDPGASAVLRRAALEAIFVRPDRPMRPVLQALLGDEGVAVAAADALSRMEGGHGLGALLPTAVAERERRFDAPLAIGVRRHLAVLDPDRVLQARAHLRADDGPRGLVLASIALDPEILPRVRTALDSSDPERRAAGALAALFFPDPVLTPILTSRLLIEEDPAAFRNLALAAIRAQIAVDPARLEARFWDPAVAPDALMLAASNLGRARPRTRRRLRRTMRRSLRAAEPRVRAGAAIALGLAGEPTAWRALVAALLDEHDAIRLAAARALESLAVVEASDAIRASARVERDPVVRRALRAAARDSARPSSPIARGDELLYVHVSTAPGLAGAAVGVDVLLPDGRWLEMTSLSTGEVLVPDLPAGDAEVLVHLRP